MEQILNVIVFFLFYLDGVKVNILIKRFISITKYDIYENDDCSGNSLITFTSKYSLMYKRIDHFSIFNFNLFR